MPDYKLETFELPIKNCDSYTITIDKTEYKIAKTDYENEYAIKVKAGIWPAFDNLGCVVLFIDNNGKPVVGSGVSTNKNIKGYGIYEAYPKQTITDFFQKIIFGPPGTGKSHSVDEIANNELSVWGIRISV